MDLQGKTVVITGATSGIGYQTAIDFLKAGTIVMGVGRNQQRCEIAQTRLQNQFTESIIKIFIADLSSQNQIRTLADQICVFLDEMQHPALDVLVNNAGIVNVKKSFTEDSIEATFAVNHLAPFFLTHLLLPRLSLSEQSRVITVSSDSHYRTFFIPERAKDPSCYFVLQAYKESKLANVLFTREFNHLQRGLSPRAFAVDPGLVNTEIGLKGTNGLVKTVWNWRQSKGVSPEIPSRTILYLAQEDSVLDSDEIYWYLCKPKQPSKLSSNMNLARRLWIESCKLCGLPIPIIKG